jgi:alpha-glucuronidase
MLASRNIMVAYMTPLGLHHIIGTGHHYGPAPWTNRSSRADWNPIYYHKADSAGIGFDRTSTGSNALAQYAPEVLQ